MFSWALEAQVHVKATPKEIWDAWTDVASWPEWDASTKTMRMEESFATGAFGRRKVKGWFGCGFTLLSAEQGKRFSLKTRIFGAKVLINYYVAPWWDEKVRVVQHVEACGFFAPFLWLYLGRRWKKQLPVSMKKFSSLVEKRRSV